MSTTAVLVLLISGLGILVTGTLLARRIGAPVPVVLVVVGVGVSFLPGLPSFEPSPAVVLQVVLPPILYAAAVQVRIIDLRRDWVAVGAFAVLLVLVSAAASALLLALLPGLAVAAAVAGGAVVSPPDAVSATSVGRQLRLPARLLTLLEGEGLLNDATALVLLGSALDALGARAADPVGSGALFGYTVLVSTAIGLLAGAGSAALRVRLSDPVLDTAASIAIPFAASAVAVTIGGSGVLAVVVAGLYTGRAVRRRLSAAARAAWRTNWSTIQFLLENGVFLLIGLELRALVDDAGSSAPGLICTVAIGLMLTAALAVVRLIWTILLIRVLGALDQWHRKKGGAAREAPLRRRDAVVLGWAGMRGVVTLAAAQTLPAPLHLRAQLVLIAFVVVAATLVIQGGTLPVLIRRLHVQGPHAEDRRAEIADLLGDIIGSGIAVLDAPAAVLDGEPPDPEVVDRVRRHWQREIEVAKEAPHEVGTPHRDRPQHSYRVLSGAVLAGARARLLSVRTGDRYSSGAVNRAQSVLDAAEQRLRSLDEL